MGAGAGSLSILNLAKKSHNELADERQQLQVSASVLVLENLGITTEQDSATKNVIDEQTRQVEQHKTRIREMEMMFWNRLPQWGLLGLCIGSGLVGFVTGFAGFWFLGLFGSVLLYSCIRDLYFVMRRIAPQSCDRPEIIAAIKQGQKVSLRDNNRIFPTAVKISILFLMAAVILGFALSMDFWPSLR